MVFGMKKKRNCVQIPFLLKVKYHGFWYEKEKKLCPNPKSPKHVLAHSFLNIQWIFNLKKVLESYELGLFNGTFRFSPSSSLYRIVVVHVMVQIGNPIEVGDSLKTILCLKGRVLRLVKFSQI